MRPTPSLGPLLGFLTITAVAIGSLVVLRHGPDEPPRPSPPPVTAGPSVMEIKPSSSPGDPSPAPPEPVVLDPRESPQAPPGECSTSMTIREFATTTTGDLARASQAILVATIVDAGTARWDTVDGRVPVRNDRDAFHVVRLARIRVDDVLAGGLESNVVAFPGGTIGCWHFLMDSTPSDIRPGDRFVLVIRGAPHDPLLADFGLVSETWPFEGDRVRARESGALTIAELRAANAAP
jgi:hypothetical protein